MQMKALLIYEEPTEEMKKFTDYPLPTVLGKNMIRHYVDILREELDIAQIYLYSRSPSLDVVESLENVQIVDNTSELSQGTFIMIPLNVYVPSDALKILVNYHASTGSDITVLIAPSENALGFLTFDIDPATGKITGVSTIREERPDLVLTGVGVVEGHRVPAILSRGWEALNELMMKGSKIDKTYWSGEWCRIETPWDLLALARASLLSEREPGLYIHPRAKISTRALIETKEGPVIIDENAYIDHDVLIRGPVYIGREVYVGYGSLVRNYTIIEEKSSIGSNVDITESVILRETTIGRGSYISCSVIGERVIIEPGVVTRSVARTSQRKVKGREVEKRGSIIGSGSRVGTYTVLSPGMFVEKNSIIEPLSKL
ncbi:MAG: NDP-sugar synthase [Crenarchaeota archaeon]|nr:NDP-sugar synthase [Thermoproteota archaeon]